MTILAAAQNGNYFVDVVKACGISADDAKASPEKICPAIADGKAVLDDLYGSSSAAMAEMKQLTSGLDESAVEKISAIGATSVLAVLANTYAAPATLAGAPAETPQSGGILVQL